jgi:2-oxo-4-hydroxy-4-carboxy-5-ureidoimidazoline decarboxylase
MRFHQLNDAYRMKFGIPFIICVRRHTKGSILRQFELRLMNEASSELDTALAEVFRIAALRLDQHVCAPDRLPVHGRLSTHVLDTWSGHPAAAVTIELFELSDAGESRLVTQARTNREGRTDAPLIHGRPIPISRYELRFAVGDYFAGLGTPLADPPFLDLVPVRFSVAEPEGHYHVPLLVTPWSYTTYRGS